MLYKYNNMGEYVGEYPPNPDGYIPDGFTEIKPPAPPSNSYVKWNGSDWEILRDWRGTTLYEQKDGYKTIWYYKKAPDLENTYVESPPPPNDKSRWNGKRWVYCSKARRLQAKIDRLRVPVIKKGDTAWKYDLLSQWNYQLAENQRRSHDNKCIIHDAFGNRYKLSTRSLNDLQKRCFNAFIGEK